jgi:UDP-N-acetylglucosamine--N-acetylmuramyl-(pentapeptide) pyrophosphoryl-undecaprenol N-acetylglucosamine transferase
MTKVATVSRKPIKYQQRMQATDHVVFAGGGTPGRLFPGLAVADQLQRFCRGPRITFVGRGSAFERAEVARAGYEFVAIAARPFPRKPWEAVGFLANHLARTREAGRFLRKHRVSLVLGLGGYASVPVGRAAASQGLPLVLLEQNAVASRANRWLAPSAALICSAFEVEKPWRCNCPVRVLGNPVRRSFVRNFDMSGASSSRAAAGGPRLVVLGGGQGATVLNEQVPRALYKLGPAIHSWQIVHQAGERDVETTATLYRKLGLKAQVRALIENLPELLAGADLAIGQCGGTMLAELAVCGVPALLVPNPQATGDRQRKNADRFVAAGAAALVDVREVTGRLDNRLAEVLVPLIADATVRDVMSAAMRQLARPRAAAEVAALIGELIGAASSRAAG